MDRPVNNRQGPWFWVPIGSQRATAEAWRSGHIAVITGVGPAGWAAW